MGNPLLEIADVRTKPKKRPELHSAHGNLYLRAAETLALSFAVGLGVAFLLLCFL